MAVVQGNTALAADYNTLRGEVNRWFSDNYAGGIAFGNVNQTYGWGGSLTPVVAQGDPILSSEMNPLIDRCYIGANICNNVSGAINRVAAGEEVTAAKYNETETKSDDITTNRLDIEAGQLSLSAGGSSVRAVNWAAAINATFRYTFASFDKARYFFNSGGAFNISGTITGYSTGTNWDGEGFNEIFTTMGTVLMDYTETTQSGTGGFPTALGYYDLTTVYQTIFSQTGTGVYTDATLLIEARYGLSGAYIEIRVTLTPGAGRIVDGTTTVTTQYRKLDDETQHSESLVITAPAYSLIDPF